MTAGEGQPRWAEIAYDAIAPVYDDFTAHHDYDLWLGKLMPKLEPHGIPPGKRLLDVGCGTGKKPASRSSRLEESVGPPILPETHRERHFPEATVRAALEAAGLECLDVYGHHHDAIPHQPVDEVNHAKGVYIARAASETA